MIKKLFAIALASILALASMGAVVAPAFAKTVTPNLVGSAGVMPSACASLVLTEQGFFNIGDQNLACQVTTSREAPNMVIKETSTFFVRPLVTIMPDNNKIGSGALGNYTYVYFDVSKAEYNMWKAGNLAIFYWNPDMKNWSQLHTFSVGGTSFRLAALISGFGTYGLGQ